MVLVVVAGLACPLDAHGDDDEASLHVHLVGGMARLGDDDSADGKATTAPLVGVAGRFGLATSDWFQYDAALTLATTGAASFELGMFEPPGAPPVAGPFTLSSQLARLDVGATARLGVRFIPTARLALGVQARRVSSPLVTVGGADQGGVRDADLGIDLVAVASVGFDYRINRRNIVGIALGGSYAVPLGGAAFQTVEGYVFWSRYWYPRW